MIKWWGKGFTECRWHVSRAKPLFPSHYQPKIPKDLGFYDLRLSETRELQAKFAKESGIDAFFVTGIIGLVIKKD